MRCNVLDIISSSNATLTSVAGETDVVKSRVKQTWWDHRWTSLHRISIQFYRGVQTDKHEFQVWCLEHIDAGLRGLYPGISDTQISGVLIINLLFMLDEPEEHPNIHQNIQQGVGISSSWLDAMYTWERSCRSQPEQVRWEMLGRMVLKPCF